VSAEPLMVAAGGAVRAAFTTRAGGVSEGPWAGLNLGTSGGDRPERVRENRRRACAALGLDADRVTMGAQVHGAHLRRIDAPSRPGRFTGGLRPWPEGDAMATERPGLALVVIGADCLPVLVWRRDRAAVAAAHAGWRGLVGGVLRAAVDALGDPARTGAAIGPGVGPCCYPVAAALRERFAAAWGEGVVRGPAVDLAAAARRELERAGVPASAISAVEACTSCEPERFYSYRRDGERTGRQAGLVWIEAR
jgi:purine-nucleoside/S-methyl-5'-thioadenosine phosphorylase / adenosine deaminase